MRVRIFLVCILWFQASFVAAEAAAVERFDTSGMPNQPTTFLEQQIWEAVKHHRAGDTLDAILVQRRLARFYQQIGDTTRAEVASRLASDAERSAAGHSAWKEVSVDSNAASSLQPQTQNTSPAVRTSGKGVFSGNYYARTSGNAMEKWDFSFDGGFTHTGAASGLGASVRNFERGTYEIAGKTLTLHIAATVNAYATTRENGSSRDTAATTRQVTVQLLGAHGENGIVIDGQRFSPRHGW